MIIVAPGEGDDAVRFPWKVRLCDVAVLDMVLVKEFLDFIPARPGWKVLIDEISPLLRGEVVFIGSVTGQNEDDHR